MLPLYIRYKVMSSKTAAAKPANPNASQAYPTPTCVVTLNPNPVLKGSQQIAYHAQLAAIFKAAGKKPVTGHMVASTILGRRLLRRSVRYGFLQGFAYTTPSQAKAAAKAAVKVTK